MNSAPFYLNPQLKNLICMESGEIINQNEILVSEQVALSIGERLLGSTLLTNNTLFIISMVELYYGGIGDDCHDWFRRSFQKNTKSSGWDNATIQLEEGLCFYIKNEKPSNWNRSDIVIGLKGVPVSFLIRNIIKDDGIPLVSRRTGGPGLTMKALYSPIFTNGSLIKFEPSEINSKFHILLDTHDAFFELNKPEIYKNKRCKNNRFDGLPGKYKDKLWNLSIHSSSFVIPDEIKLRTSHLLRM